MRTLTRLTLTALTALTASLTLTPNTAHAVQVEPADRDVTTVRVSYVERVGHRAYVELNNGAAYRLNPCRVEDGRHCYWSAGTVGNGRGDSFVVVAGQRHYLNRALTVDLAGR